MQQTGRPAVHWRAFLSGASLCHRGEEVHAERLGGSERESSDQAGETLGEQGKIARSGMPAGAQQRRGELPRSAAVAVPEMPQHVRGVVGVHLVQQAAQIPGGGGEYSRSVPHCFAHTQYMRGVLSVPHPALKTGQTAKKLR